MTIQQAGIQQSQTAEIKALADPRQWAALGADIMWQDFANAWLAIQCDLLTNCHLAHLRVMLDDETEITSTWPPSASTHAALHELQQPLNDAIEQNKGIVAPGTQDDTVYAAYPLLLEGNAIGAVSVSLHHVDQKELVQAMRRLQWGITWLRERAFRERATKGTYDSGTAATVLDFLAIAFEEQRLEDSARAMVTAIADKFDCERVSLGLFKRKQIKILAVSHAAHFGKEMNLVSMLSGAMNEAVDEGHVFAYTAAEQNDFLAPAHSDLAREHGSDHILTVPLMLDDAPIGAMTLEKSGKQGFAIDQATIIDILATAIAPVIEEKRLNERSIVSRLRDDIARSASALLKPDGAAYKFTAAGLALLALLFTFWYGDHEVVADAVLEGREQRMISAGFEGYLKSATARAGDRVEKNAVLANLDDRDLLLQRAKILAEKQKSQISYEKAFSERDPTGMRVSQSRTAQADAQIKLINEQIRMAKITAPFDGVVVAGDLSQRIGDAVQRGEILYKIAPAESYRVMLKVAEEDSFNLTEGQVGRLVLAARPGETYPIEIKRITPVSEIADGKNIFWVEALPVKTETHFRPGLRGAARIEVGRRRVIWLWTHSFFNWARLAWWKLF